MKKVRSIFLFFFAFLHINKPNEKPNEFKNHLRSLMEEEIRNALKERSFITIETDDEIEQECFMLSYANEIMNHCKINKINLINFNKYNKQDEWDNGPTHFAHEIQNLKKYKSKYPVFIYLKNAELLLQQDNKDTIKEFFQIRNNYIKKNIPCFFGIQIGNKKKIDEKIKKSIDNKIDEEIKKSTNNRLFISLHYRLKKDLLFEKCLFEVKNLINFPLKKEKCKNFLSNITTTKLLKFFSEIKEKNQTIEEKKFYKELYIASLHEKGREKNQKFIETVAVHQIGNALLSHREKRLHYVSIIPEMTPQINSSGVTSNKISTEEIHSADYLYNELDCLFAGIAAEEEILGVSRPIGGLDDQRKATEIASYIVNYGLGKKLKIVPQEKNPTFYQEIDELLEESKARTKKYIHENKDLITYISKKLVKEEILFEDEFEEIIKEFKAKKS